MSGKNFSPGDVVVCVDASVCFPYPHGVEVRKGHLYTVEGYYDHNGTALLSAFTGKPPIAPAVLLREVRSETVSGRFNQGRFRLAFTPDPEVSREYTETPVKLKEPAQ